MGIPMDKTINEENHRNFKKPYLGLFDFTFIYVKYFTGLFNKERVNLENKKAALFYIAYHILRLDLYLDKLFSFFSSRIMAMRSSSVLIFLSAES